MGTMRTFFTFILTSSSLLGQSGPIFGQFVPQKLARFLNLSEAQTRQLVDQLDQYGLVVSEVQRRMNQLYEEVVVETSQPQPRAAELGVRYVEIEMTCRRAIDEHKRLRERNLAVLNASQKERLKLLSDALKLLPEIGEAQYMALMDGQPYFGLMGELPQVEETGGCSVMPQAGYGSGVGPGTAMLRRLPRQPR